MTRSPVITLIAVDEGPARPTSMVTWEEPARYLLRLINSLSGKSPLDNDSDNDNEPWNSRGRLRKSRGEIAIWVLLWEVQKG